MKGLDVAVVGAGIAGIEAALTIADHGIRVHLIEIEPSIGGHMAQLDTTFPTNDSSMCLLSSKMAGVERHPMIVLHTMAEVSAVSGDAFDYTVRLATHPRYVDASACTGCGACSEACPVEVYNRYDAGIGVRKAIYVPHPRAIPHIAVRDAEHCIDCGLCYDTCTAGAIARNEPERESYLQVAGIVIATGYEPYDPAEKKAFRYLDYPDVITSLEFERMLAADGPTSGEIRRLSDGKRPDSIVFISCVGSREKKEGRNYCSCVCCMYTAKNARRVGEKYPDVQVTVMRSDIRAYGKGYQEYFKSAKKDAGVKYIGGLTEAFANEPEVLETTRTHRETARRSADTKGGTEVRGAAPPRQKRHPEKLSSPQPRPARHSRKCPSAKPPHRRYRCPSGPFRQGRRNGSLHPENRTDRGGSAASPQAVQSAAKGASPPRARRGQAPA